MQLGWIIIASLAIFIIALVVGYVRGFLRSILTFGHLIIAIVLMVVLAPHVQGLLTRVGVEGIVRTKIETVIEERIEERAEEEIRRLGSQMGVELDADIDIENPVVRGLVDLYQSRLSTREQNEIIEESTPGGILSRLLQAHNTAEEYARLGVERLSDYIAAYLTVLIMKIIAALLVFILAEIILHILLVLSEVIDRIPVIGGINRVLGAILGAAIGLLIIWLLYFFLTLLINTAFGAAALEDIAGNVVTQTVYDLDPFLRILG